MLTSALANRDELSLLPLLRFLQSHISNPRFSHLLIDVVNLLLGNSLSSDRELFLHLSFPLGLSVLPFTLALSSALFSIFILFLSFSLVDLYSRSLGHFPTIDRLFTQLNQRITEETRFHKQLFQLQGLGDIFCSFLSSLPFLGFLCLGNPISPVK